MAKQISIVPASLTTTNFTIWTTALHTGFLLGWVQTTDAGQIDPYSVTYPGTGVDAGYLIYRMNDSLQSANPVFCKIIPGGGTSVSGAPSLKLQIGTGTDNLGNLTGATSAQRVMTYSSNNGGGNSYFSVDTDRIQCCCWAGGSTESLFFSIERDLDSSGITTTNGIHFLTWGGSVGPTAPISQFIASLSFGPAGPTEAKIVTLISSQLSQTSNSLTGLGVVRANYGSLRNPSVNLLIGSKGEFVSEIPCYVSLYGVTRTFIPLVNAAFLGVGNNTAPVLLMRWD